MRRLTSLILLVAAFLSTHTTLWSQTTYTWSGGGSGSWATAANWSPTPRTTPAVDDILIINSTATITDVPTETIGQLQITGSATVSLSSTGVVTLTMNSVTIESNAELIIGTAMTLTCKSTFTLYGKVSGTNASTSVLAMGRYSTFAPPDSGDGGAVSQLKVAVGTGSSDPVSFSGICNLQSGASFEIDNWSTMNLADDFTVVGGTIELMWGKVDLYGNALTLNGTTLNVSENGLVDDGWGSGLVVTKGNTTIDLGGYFYVPLQVFSGTTNARSEVYNPSIAGKASALQKMISVSKLANARPRKVLTSVDYWQFGSVEVISGATLLVPSSATLSIASDLDVDGTISGGNSDSHFIVDGTSLILSFLNATVSVAHFDIIEESEYHHYIDGTANFTGSTVYLDASWVQLDDDFTMTGGTIQLPDYAGIDTYGNTLTLDGCTVSIASGGAIDDYYLYEYIQPPPGKTTAKAASMDGPGVVITKGGTSIEQGGDFYVPLQVDGTTSAWNVETGGGVIVPASTRKHSPANQLATAQRKGNAKRRTQRAALPIGLTWFNGDVYVSSGATLSVPSGKTMKAGMSTIDVEEGGMSGPGQFYFDGPGPLTNNGSISAPTFVKAPSSEYVPQITGDGVWSNLTFEGSVEVYDHVTMRASNVTNHGSLEVYGYAYQLVNSTFTNASDGYVHGSYDSFETDSTVSIVQNGTFDETLVVKGGTTTAEGVFLQPIIVWPQGTLNVAVSKTLTANHDVTLYNYEDFSKADLKSAKLRLGRLAKGMTLDRGKITGAGNLLFKGYYSSFWNRGDVDVATTFQDSSGDTKTINGSGGTWRSLTIGPSSNTRISDLQVFTGAPVPFVVNGTVAIDTFKTISYSGTSTQTICPLTYQQLQLSNPAGATLPASITVHIGLEILHGNLNTGANTITLGSIATLSESGGSVVGKITSTRPYDTGVGFSANVGLQFHASGTSPTTVTATRVTGTAPTISGVTAIKRYFDISPTPNSGLNSNLKFFFKTADLNGTTPSTLMLYKSTDAGASWTVQSGTTVNLGDSTLNLTGIDSFSRWTAGQCAPTVTSVSPTQGIQGQTLNDTLNGSYFVNGATNVSYSGSGITVNSKIFISTSQIVANITISASATVGTRDVSVTTGGGTATLASAFQVKYPPPVLSSISPTSGQQGTTIKDTLSGSNFVSGGTTVGYSGTGITVNSVSFVSASQVVADITISASAAVGTRDVSVTTGGGTATMTGAFQVKYPPPVLSSISPTSGQQGTTIKDTLNGSNFVSGGTTVSYSGTGITVNSVSFVSASQVVADITIAAGATTGPRDVSVTTASGTSTLASAFQVVSSAAPAPTLTSISPTTANQGQSLTVTLNGTNFVSGGTTVGFSGTGITVNSTTFISAAQITAGITIAAGAAAGKRDVSVTTSGGTATLSQAFEVQVPPNPTPTLFSASPATGSRGQSLAVTLQGTGFQNGLTTVAFGSGITVTSVSVTNAASLTAQITIAAGAVLGARTVSVTNPAPGGGTASTSAIFSVTNPTPTVTAVSPTSGGIGQILDVTLTGTNFVQDTSKAGFGSGVNVVSTTFVSPTSLTARIAIDSAATPGLRDVTVVNTGPGGGSGILSSAFTIVNPVPSISRVTPDSGASGGTVNVTLTGSGFIVGVTTVSAGPDISVSDASVLSSTQMTARFAIAPTASNGPRTVSVTNAAPGGGSSSLVNGFRIVNPIPTITSVTPVSGTSGQTLTLTVSGTNFIAGQTTVSLGSGFTTNSVTVSSPTQLTASIAISPSTAGGPRNVTVTNVPPGGGSATLSGGFLVNNPVPTLLTLSATTGDRGKTIGLLIGGSGFITGVSTMTFGAGITLNSISVTTPTQIYVNITIAPDAAFGTRDVSVINAAPGGGTATLRAIFTVDNPFPVLSSITPNTGTLGQSLSVTMVGSGFISGVSTVAFGAGITVNSATPNVAGAEITASITIAAGATAGVRNVSVTNPAPGGGTFTMTGGFSILAPAPTLTSISPTIGTKGQTLTITLTGTSFVAGLTTPSFGAGITVNSSAVTSSTQMTANIAIGPDAAAGARNVVVTTPPPGGGSATLTGGLTVQNPSPALSAIVPTQATRGDILDVTLTGDNFIQGITTVSFGDGITVNSVTVSSLTRAVANISVSAGAVLGSRTVSVTNPAPGGGSAALTSAFTIGNPAPTLASINPATGKRGQTLSVTLTGTGFVSGSTTVQFGSNIVVNTLVVNNPAQMTANISIGFDAVPGARSVSVTNAAPGGGTATLPNALTVENPAPTLSSIAPVIGSRGSTLSVTLTGSNFSSGLSQVSFGADIQVNSTSVTDPTQIVVNITIPMSSTTGARNVVVTHAAPGGGIATLTGAFSVVNPTPTITGISPTGGERGSVLSVTITGSQFISGVTTVSFGADVTVSSVVVRSPAEIQANITVSPTASLGARTVTVTNPAPGGGSASLSSAFTVGNPVPTIVSITPVSAGRGSMLNVTVIGTQFISGVTSLSFGTPDVSISNIVVKSVTELQASVSISATASLGTRSVTVTNASPGGGLAALTNAFTVSSSPATGMVADGVLPDQYLLQEAYPNPFNPSTRIGFGLPEDSRIRLDVHNMLGNVVAELAVGERAKGLYQLQWHAENLPSGVYLIRLHAESLESTKRFVASRKVVLVK